MKILIVAMSNSIHTARWIAQIADQGWDIHLFPSIDVATVHPECKNLKVYLPIYGKQQCSNSVKIIGFPVINNKIANGLTFIIKSTRFYKKYQLKRLIRLIKKIKPDIIQSIEIQHAGYLSLEAKKILKDNFPPWIVTNWGSDIYLFGRLSEHEPKIREVLALCDYYSSECQRDVSLAKAYGFKGTILPVFPNTGGFDLELVTSLRQTCLVSERRIIMLKGYQGWSGRALVGLRALERCAELLQGYQIVLYSVHDSLEVKIAAELLAKSTGIPIKFIPDNTSHKEILRLHGQARISIGLGISDAISTSLLEAITMGSFPIQSYTACAYEWIEDGKTGILVPPDDPEIVELAIRRALTDDVLVNQAAENNFRTATERINHLILKQKTIEMYQHIYEWKQCL